LLHVHFSDAVDRIKQSIYMHVYILIAVMQVVEAMLVASEVWEANL
jgi:hypothetical protein